MNELLVVEKLFVGGGSELVRQGYSAKLLNKYLARAAYGTPNAVFVLRAARATDCLGNVPMVNCIVKLKNPQR